MKNQEISPQMPVLTKGKTQNQSGNIFFIIMLAIALFAGLSFVISQSSRTGQSNMTIEQAKLKATEIIGYTDRVKQAVKLLQINGCTDTQINFENDSSGSTYDNGSAPTDETCDVFSNKGGGLRWIDPPDPFKFSDPAFYTGKYFIYSGTVWEGVGSDCTNASCTDLMMGLNGIDRQTCVQMNKLLGIDGIPYDTEWGGSAFTGSYTYDHALADETNGVNAVAKQAACFSYGAGDNYSFAKVLIAR